MAASSSGAVRRTRAVESFQSAAECIGTIEPGTALFALTRGQFSLIDAILHCLSQTGPANISIWTWTVAAYDVTCMERLAADGRITAGTMVIDNGTRNKEKRSAGPISRWQDRFGPNSVKRLLNHAKIATIESDKFKILLRGSMNLNCNPQFEQFDLTEGGPDFDFVRRIEAELPILPPDASRADVYKASKVSAAWGQERFQMFDGLKTWAK